MQWLPGFYWKEMEGKNNVFLGGSLLSFQVAILLWEEFAVPPALMWQWQVLHEGIVRASGGEATRALGTMASQNAYSRYIGALPTHNSQSSRPRKLRYIWAPANGSQPGDGKGVGRVPGDPLVRLRVSRCNEQSDKSLWFFRVTRGAEEIAQGYRASKGVAVFAAEDAYVRSCS